MARPPKPLERDAFGALYLGSLIRHYRQERGLSLAEFAERVERHPDAISKIETNGALPSPDLLDRMAHELDIPNAEIRFAPHHPKLGDVTWGSSSESNQSAPGISSYVGDRKLQVKLRLAEQDIKTLKAEIRQLQQLLPSSIRLTPLFPGEHRHGGWDQVFALPIDSVATLSVGKDVWSSDSYARDLSRQDSRRDSPSSLELRRQLAMRSWNKNSAEWLDAQIALGEALGRESTSTAQFEEARSILMQVRSRAQERGDGDRLRRASDLLTALAHWQAYENESDRESTSLSD